MQYKALIKKIWSEVYDPKLDVRAVVEKYFHADYGECINGATMKRSEYIDHVIAQREGMTVSDISYKHLVESGNEAFGIYYPIGISKEGKEIKAEVVGYFKFEGSQILNIHGQVRFISGDKQAADMS
jgi:hypothetical protein